MSASRIYSYICALRLYLLRRFVTALLQALPTTSSQALLSKALRTVYMYMYTALLKALAGWRKILDKRATRCTLTAVVTSK